MFKVSSKLIGRVKNGPQKPNINYIRLKEILEHLLAVQVRSTRDFSQFAQSAISTAYHTSYQTKKNAKNAALVDSGYRKPEKRDHVTEEKTPKNVLKRVTRNREGYKKQSNVTRLACCSCIKQ